MNGVKIIDKTWLANAGTGGHVSSLTGRNSLEVILERKETGGETSTAGFAVFIECFL